MNEEAKMKEEKFNAEGLLELEGKIYKLSDNVITFRYKYATMKKVARLMVNKYQELNYTQSRFSEWYDALMDVILSQSIEDECYNECRYYQKLMQPYTGEYDQNQAVNGTIYILWWKTDQRHWAYVGKTTMEIEIRMLRHICDFELENVSSLLWEARNCIPNALTIFNVDILYRTSNILAKALDDIETKYINMIPINCCLNTLKVKVDHPYERALNMVTKIKQLYIPGYIAPVSNSFCIESSTETTVTFSYTPFPTNDLPNPTEEKIISIYPKLQQRNYSFTPFPIMDTSSSSTSSSSSKKLLPPTKKKFRLYEPPKISPLLCGNCKRFYISTVTGRQCSFCNDHQCKICVRLYNNNDIALCQKCLVHPTIESILKHVRNKQVYILGIKILRFRIPKWQNGKIVKIIVEYCMPSDYHVYNGNSMIPIINEKQWWISKEKKDYWKITAADAAGSTTLNRIDNPHYYTSEQIPSNDDFEQAQIVNSKTIQLCECSERTGY